MTLLVIEDEVVEEGDKVPHMEGEYVGEAQGEALSVLLPLPLELEQKLPLPEKVGVFDREGEADEHSEGE